MAFLISDKSACWAETLSHKNDILLVHRLNYSTCKFWIYIKACSNLQILGCEMLSLNFTGSEQNYNVHPLMKGGT